MNVRPLLISTFPLEVDNSDEKVALSAVGRGVTRVPKIWIGESWTTHCGALIGHLQTSPGAFALFFFFKYRRNIHGAITLFVLTETPFLHSKV